jgi:predicted permease
MRCAFHRSRLEQQMDEELRFHLDARTDDLVRAGLAPEAARRRARVELGGVEARKEACRDALGLRLVDELASDARYAYRQLRRSPVFTAVAVLSLALGIGANTAIFSLMEAAVWKAIAVHEPERLALFSWVSGPRQLMNSTSGNWFRNPTGGRASTSFSYPIFEALRRQSAFDTVFAFKPLGRVTAVVDGEAELVQAQLVSGDFYRGVGVVPIAGRPIRPEDDVRGGTETVAVISDGYWARRFARNPSAVGATIRVNQVAVTIVGVNPPAFAGVEPGDFPDVFMPLNTQPLVLPWKYSRTGSLLDDPDYWWVLVMGRLKPDVTRTQAQSALEVAFQQAVTATLPDRTDRDRPQFRLLAGSRGQDNMREAFGTPLFVLGALVGIVLLIACANVANLLLVRAAARRRELSLRLALGAGRWRITRQLLTEGLALGVSGGALGLVFAYWTRNAIPHLLVPSWEAEMTFNAEFDSRVLLLTVGVTMATTIVSSVAPIWQSLRVEIHAALKDGGRAAMAAPVALRGKSLVILQVCLSVLLLIGAGLFVRTLSNLRSVSLGFRPERVVLFTIDPPRARYLGHARKALFERLDQAIGALPGVEAASLSENALVSGGSSQTRVGPDGRIPGPKDEAWVNDVGSRFFETMSIPILVGRSFDEHDRETSPPVTVVNQRFVTEFFPGQNPIGKTVRNNNLLYEIVGVCGDTPFGRLRAPVPPTFYRHFTQAGEPGDMTFEVRTVASETAIMSSVRGAVRAIDKDLPVFDVRTQMEQIDAVLARERLFVALTSAFGVLALVLASIGIYGVMANGVSRRTNEIGVRLALGAARRDVLVMILREVSWLAVLGAALGVTAAVVLGRYIRAMLFGITPVDPATIGGAVAAMMLVALLAGWFPARKASQLDPMIALRHE